MFCPLLWGTSHSIPHSRSWLHWDRPSASKFSPPPKTPQPESGYSCQLFAPGPAPRGLQACEARPHHVHSALPHGPRTAGAGQLTQAPLRSCLSPSSTLRGEAFTLKSTNPAHMHTPELAPPAATECSVGKCGSHRRVCSSLCWVAPSSRGSRSCSFRRQGREKQRLICC